MERGSELSGDIMHATHVPVWRIIDFFGCCQQTVARLAQSVGYKTHNLTVVGSSPPLGASFVFVIILANLRTLSTQFRTHFSIQVLLIIHSQYIVHIYIYQLFWNWLRVFSIAACANNLFSELVCSWS